MGNGPSCKALIFICNLGKYVFSLFFYRRFPGTSGIPVMLSVMGTVCQSKASAFPFLPRTVNQLLVDAIQSLSVISSLGRICFLSLIVFEEIIVS